MLVFARMNRILELDIENQRAVVQPGLVNYELTRAAEPHGLYFAPDPSRALALDPKDINARYNLANELEEKDDLPSAIREFRQAKRLAPDRFDVRMNLSSALVQGNFNRDAIVELRELEVMFPDSALCHQALGRALHLTSDFKGAEKEFRKASELDPSDAEHHLSRGAVQEDQENYDAALEEYRKAEELDENSAHAHRNAGRIMLVKQNFAEAVNELRQAAALAPSDAYIHDVYGQALKGSENLDAAVAEFKQALLLDPKQPEVRVNLAALLERKGDWPGSLDQYRRASLAGSTVPLGNGVFQVITPNPQLQYKSAQERFNQHLVSLKAAGKSAEAAKREACVATSQAGSGITEKVDAAMQAGYDAFMQRQWDQAIRNYKKAIELSEKLQPHDGRLAIALGELGRSRYSFPSPVEGQRGSLRRPISHVRRATAEPWHDGSLSTRLCFGAELPRSRS